MYEAKTRLSEIVATVVAMDPPAQARRLGFAKDIEILEGFDDLPEGFEDYV